MSATPSSRSYIEKALEDARAERDIATARLCRLFRETFEDGDRAIRAYSGLVRERGLEATIRVLEQDDGLFGRSWHFGWMRGGLLAQGNRTKARECLNELPSVMRDHYKLFTREQDLERALEAARREERERGRPAEPERREPDWSWSR